MSSGRDHGGNAPGTCRTADLWRYSGPDRVTCPGSMLSPRLHATARSIPVRYSLSCIALALALGPAAVAGASITYNLVNYPADQGGAMLSGYFTVRDHSNELSTFAILDWS